MTEYNANFSDAKMCQTNMASVKFLNVNFAGADMRRAILTNAVLRESNFCGADLREANLEGADLGGVIYDRHTRWPLGYKPPVDALLV